MDARVIAALGGAALLVAACGPKPEDYAWSPAAAEVKAGDGARIAVRLEGPSGVVTLGPEDVDAARLTMDHDGTAMAAPLRPVVPAAGESLAWEADLSMGGQWALEVAATVPGQSEPLKGEVIFTVEE